MAYSLASASNGSCPHGWGPRLTFKGPRRKRSSLASDFPLYNHSTPAAVLLSGHRGGHAGCRVPRGSDSEHRRATRTGQSQRRRAELHPADATELGRRCQPRRHSRRRRRHFQPAAPVQLQQTTGRFSEVAASVKTSSQRVDGHRPGKESVPIDR